MVIQKECKGNQDYYNIVVLYKQEQPYNATVTIHKYRENTDVNYNIITGMTISYIYITDKITGFSIKITDLGNGEAEVNTYEI